MTEIPDLPPVLERLLDTGDHDVIGAYALDSLPPEERIAFEAHLRACAECQAELSVLREAARVLHRAIVPTSALPPPESVVLPPTTEPPLEPLPEEQPAETEDADEPVPGPSLPVTEPAVDDEPAGDSPSALASEGEEAPAAELDEAPPADEEPGAFSPPPLPEQLEEAPVVAPEPAPPPRRSRPRGRVAPGIQPSAESLAAVAPATPSKLPWIVAALGLLFGIGAIVAALALAESNDNLEDEIAVQNTLIDDLNAQRDAYLQQTTAITWTLAPTTLGDPASSAVIFADPGGTSAILSASGMPAPSEGRAYQIWYLVSAEESVPGPILEIDGNGNGLARLEPDLSPYQAVAVTIEPASGSEVPSTDPVLQGFFTT